MTGRPTRVVFSVRDWYKIRERIQLGIPHPADSWSAERILTQLTALLGSAELFEHPGDWPLPFRIADPSDVQAVVLAAYQLELSRLVEIRETCLHCVGTGYTHARWEARPVGEGDVV